jgi:hypothetical protein
MSEIMLLPNSKKKLNYVGSKTIKTILDPLFKK